MEIIGVVDIFHLGGIKLLLECPEVIFTEFSRALGGEGLLDGVLEAIFVLAIDGLAGRLGEALSVEVFAVNLRDVARVSWDMLSLDITIWTTDPIFTFKRVISVLKLVGGLILGWRTYVIIVFVELGLGDRNVDIVRGWLVSSFR